MTSEMSDRPRPRSFVHVDLNNAYARLSVSPLASDREIKQAYNTRDRQLRAQLRDKTSQEFGSVEQQITDLQHLEELIGSPKARARYDEDHPYNELLTVQSLPNDRFDDALHRATLVTAWLIEQLGSEGFLPTPHSQALWEGTTGLAFSVGVSEQLLSVKPSGNVDSPPVAMEELDFTDLDRLVL